MLEFERSGLTRQAFCAQHGLSIAALDKYRRQGRAIDRQPEQPQSSANRILPVEFIGGIASAQASTNGSSRRLWVELANGRRIEVAQGYDAPTLERLVAVLEKA